jgi:hypothetical protein
MWEEPEHLLLLQLQSKAAPGLHSCGVHLKTMLHHVNSTYGDSSASRHDPKQPVSLQVTADTLGPHAPLCQRLSNVHHACAPCVTQ